MTDESVTAIYIDLRRNRVRCYFGDDGRNIDFDLPPGNVKVQDLSDLNLRPRFDRVRESLWQERVAGPLLKEGALEAIREMVRLFSRLL